MEALKIKKILLIAFLATVFIVGISYLKLSMTMTQHSRPDSNMLTDGSPISIGIMHTEPY